MRASCPSSQVTANGRPLTVKLICPTSSPFPQDATDPGERLIDARRDLFELRAIAFVTGPVGPRAVSSRVTARSSRSIATSSSVMERKLGVAATDAV